MIIVTLQMLAIVEQFYLRKINRQKGSKIYVLSKDHKPSEENERKRIIENGGQVYQLND